MKSITTTVISAILLAAIAAPSLADDTGIDEFKAMVLLRIINTALYYRSSNEDRAEAHAALDSGDDDAYEAVMNGLAVKYMPNEGPLGMFRTDKPEAADGLVLNDRRVQFVNNLKLDCQALYYVRNSIFGEFNFDILELMVGFKDTPYYKCEISSKANDICDSKYPVDDATMFVYSEADMAGRLLQDIWTKAELKNLFCQYYHITGDENFVADG